MNILIASTDSSIGGALAKYFRERGDTVYGTSRYEGRGELRAEMAHPGRWNRPDVQIDLMFYTIATGNAHVFRDEVMRVNVFGTLDYLKFMAPNLAPGAQCVVFSSTSGSIALSEQVASPVYAMSKAALNMGVKLLSVTHPQVRWTLMCPGRVRSRYNTYPNNPDAVSAEEAVPEIVATAETARELPFTFVNRRGATLPF